MAKLDRISSFKYRSPFAKGDDHYIVNIRVKDLCYSDEKEYMDITYTFESFMEDKSIGRAIKNHPFFQSNIEEFDTYQGEIIAKNPMTAQMVEFLLMDDAELAKFTGHTTAQDYKHKIMLSIVHFWD